MPQGLWVRVPLPVPRRSKLCIACSNFFVKVRAHLRRCSSYPHRTHFAGLRFDFGKLFVRKSISLALAQVAASVISLAVSFFISLQSLSCARSAASRFQTEPTSLGFGLGLLLCGDFILLTRQYRLQPALPSKGASFWDVPFDGFRCPEG